MMDDRQIIALLEKYTSGTITDAERAILESWYIDKARNGKSELTDAELERTLALIGERLPLSQVRPDVEEEPVIEGEPVIGREPVIGGRPHIDREPDIGGQTGGKGRHLRQPATIRRTWPRFAAAAAVLLLVIGGYYFSGRKQSVPPVAQRQVVDIAPGGDKAILYSGGRRYLLDSLRDGLVANKGVVTINKNASGQLVYSNGTGNGTAMESGNGPGSLVATEEAAVSDTLIIPPGGRHAIRFADGSSVVLNADSKLRYPERFSGNRREVELISGEAQFHIRHNAAMPFYVLVKGQSIKDIGTTFNVNAYDDEPVVRTTLIEGRVEVSKGGSPRTLKPGEQAVASSGSAIDIRAVDTNEVVAWTKGRFFFEKTDLRELMRQLARWYDIDVVYEGSVPDDTFDGQVDRDESLAQMLKILQLGDVHFRIEAGDGKKAGRLIITP